MPPCTFGARGRESEGKNVNRRRAYPVAVSRFRGNGLGQAWYGGGD